MSSPGFAETLRQLKLDLAKGTPVSLRINPAGSRLTRLTPRPQDPSTANCNYRYPKYDSLKATRSQLELELANAFPTPFSSFFSAIYHASRRPNAPPRPTTYRDGNGTIFFDPFSHLAQAERLDKTTDTARWLKHLASRAAAAEGRRRLATRHPDGEGNLRAVSAYCQLDRAGKRAYLTLRLYFNRVDAEETRLNNQLYHMPSSHPRRSCIRAAFVVAEADTRAYRHALPKFDSDRCTEGLSRQQARLIAKAISAAAVSEAQRRLARQPAPSSPIRQHLYLIQHYTGVFRSGIDSVTYFYDSQLPRSADRSLHTTEHGRLELEVSALEPCRYRRHPIAHARTWQPRQAAPQSPAYLPKRLRTRLPVESAPAPAATPATLLDPLDLPTRATVSIPKVDYPDSDAASAASTIDLVAALLTLLRLVHGTLTPARRRFTRPNRCTMEARMLVPSAATDWMFRTAPTLGRWTCVPRDCRKARSSISLHHGCTDGTGTRPSFEPR